MAKDKIVDGMLLGKKGFLTCLEYVGFENAELKQKLMNLIASDAITFEKENLDNFVIGAKNFSSLDAKDKKFLFLICNCYSIEEIDSKLSTMPDGAIKERLQGIYNTVMDL